MIQNGRSKRKNNKNKTKQKYQKEKRKHPKNLLYNLQFSNFEAFSHWLNIISLF